ncbi:histidine kinase [Oscillochloris trichoides DG-6]|uniref:histidine kinase n=1 Tax=Oscillochloris trichoides DG-6 TaxID=765420 RepID=E1IFS4_9CHLR|nr:HAMP domain-containing protein [Oscillochloris trichoides]EFO79965.1 histidine kinase [Oscillochloris trichoides DG-6]
MAATATSRGVRVGLVWRFLLAALLIGLAPLGVISFFAINGYQEAGDQATEVTRATLDEKSLDSLQLRTVETANAIARFLEDRVQDARTATLIPRDAAAYTTFLAAHQTEVWYLGGTNAAPVELREMMPIFREIAYVGADGRERLRVADGKVVPSNQLRNVSDPANTTYLSEDYFAATKALDPGEVYVSHVTAWYVSQPEQLGTADDPLKAVEGKKYEAIIRFATPLYTEAGAFDGMIVLALDYRHVMGFALHILPTSTQNFTVFPDYASGNYAYMFDNEGWEIAHPRFWVLRGLDPSGQLVSPVREEMSREERGRHPMNLQYGGWADPNLPIMYAKVMQGEDGFVITVNQSNAKKATTYAPIRFAHGVYAEDGIFGGLAIGAEMAEFHQAADKVTTSIAAQRRSLEIQMIGMIIGTAVVVVIVAVVLTRSISAPVQRLGEAAQALERGEMAEEILNELQQRHLRDEVSDLAAVFKVMAEQVIQRERSLKQQIAALNIQIDDQKKRQQVESITETDYFQSLRASAGQMRRRHQDRRSGEQS